MKTILKFLVLLLYLLIIPLALLAIGAWLLKWLEDNGAMLWEWVHNGLCNTINDEPWAGTPPRIYPPLPVRKPAPGDDYQI